MRAVDTNILVRLLTRDDERQATSAETFIEKGAWVSILAVAETIWVLSAVYHRSAAQLMAAIDLLLNHKSLTIQDSDVVSEALLMFRAKPRLRFSDCIILQLARKAGHLPLGTFDSSLSKVEGAHKL